MKSSKFVHLLFDGLKLLLFDGWNDFLSFPLSVLFVYMKNGFRVFFRWFCF